MDKTKQAADRITLSSLAVIFFLSVIPAPVFGQFAMDFTPKGDGVLTDGMFRGGSWRPNSQSRFLQSGGVGEEKPEIVYDPVSDLSYYHLIVGDPADGFAQEVFIQIEGTRMFPSGARPASASGGTAGTVLTTGQHFSGNSHDPLDTIDSIDTGNGSGKPNKVIIRQLLNDGETFQEFLKDKTGFKPRITQMTVAPDITMLFDIDMRNSDYTDNTQAGSVVNTLTLSSSPSLPEGSGDFFMTSDGTNTSITAGTQQGQVVNADITGGRYTWASDTGYIYTDSNFDHTAIDWGQYFNSENDNIWTYQDFYPNN